MTSQIFQRESADSIFSWAEDASHQQLKAHGKAEWSETPSLELATFLKRVKHLAEQGLKYMILGMAQAIFQLKVFYQIKTG